MRILLASDIAKDANESLVRAWAELGHSARQLSGPEFAANVLLADRETLRKSLDAEIAAFDPQVIHCPAVWVLGQLALESGVPYTLAVGPEIDQLVNYPQVAELAQQAAENAGRIFVDDEATRSQILNEFGLDGERVMVLPRASTTDYAARLAGEFRAMLVERFGTAPE